MDRRLTWCILAGVVAGMAFLPAVLLGGLPGVLAMAAYVVLILIPGGVIFAALAARFPSGRHGLLESVFYANLIGLTMSIGAGWLLARSGVFSLEGTAALETLGVTGALLLARHRLPDWLGSLKQRGLQVRWEETAYLGVVIAVCLVLLLPLFTLLHQGYLVSDDTAVFAQSGNILVQTGSWTQSIQIFPQFPFSGPNTAFTNPGIAILYAIFSASTGVNAVYLTGPLYLVSAVVATLGLWLTVRLFTQRRLLTYSLPLLWVGGSWVESGLFSNNFVDAAWFGIIPDAVLSTVAYVAVLLLLLSLVRGQGGSQWFEVALLGCALALGTLSDQITFLFLVPAVIFFGIQMARRRGTRWTMLRLALAWVPTLILLPTYLMPSIAAGTSPAVSGKSPVTLETLFSWSLSESAGSFSDLGFLGLALAGVALGLAVYPRLHFSQQTPRDLGRAGVATLSCLAGLALYLTFTNVGADLLGVTYSRFFEYVGIPLAPLVGIALDRMLGWCDRRTLLRWSSVVAVTALLLASTVVQVQYNVAREPSLDSTGTVFGPDMLQASEWLGTNALPGATIVADAMGGNQAILPMGDFVHDTFLNRPRFTLYQLIYQAPRPSWGNPYYTMNQAMEFPTSGNAEAAWLEFSMKYYVFQVGYSDPEIEAFSHLSYFALVYSNPEVDIFEYTGVGTLGFVPAVNYTSLSPGLTSFYSGDAYCVAFGLPKIPNAIDSPLPGGASLDGTNVTYVVNVTSVGEYTLLVHRYLYQPGESLAVSVNGDRQGLIYYNSTGASFGSPLNLTLPAGRVTVTLTMANTVNFVDPIDYLILEPED